MIDGMENPDTRSEHFDTKHTRYGISKYGVVVSGQIAMEPAFLTAYLAMDALWTAACQEYLSTIDAIIQKGASERSRDPFVLSIRPTLILGKNEIQATLQIVFTVDVNSEMVSITRELMRVHKQFAELERQFMQYVYPRRRRAARST